MGILKYYLPPIIHVIAHKKHTRRLQNLLRFFLNMICPLFNYYNLLILIPEIPLLDSKNDS